MKAQRYIQILFFLVVCSLSLQAQTNQTAPKREFRAVWVATVTNIDFPSRKGMSTAYQKAEWISLLDQHQRMGLNAVIVQIRPTGDAFYPSKLVPWSEYLTGKQGKPPYPNYDPLKFMIEEAHKRNMEFHAWMNPYRLSMNLDKSQLASNHILKQHPDWCVEYGGRYYLNPALAQVRQHIGAVVGEVVKNYDVDAIHFDDYFYPYKQDGIDFPDQREYDRFGSKFPDIADWRRNNVDLLIAQLSKQIKALKPHVKFGISPFGVWRNKDVDPAGSDTRAGHTSYDDLYADILGWLEKGWIDYVAPQLYWSIGYAPADYEKLLNWWRFRTHSRHLYIGHGVYKVNDNFDTNWMEANQIPKQIRLSRQSVMSKGSIHFSSKPLLNNPLGVADSLSRYYYNHPTLIPEMAYLNIRQPKQPNLKKIKGSGQNSVELSWKYKVKKKEPLPYYFVVYRVDGKRKPNSKDGKHILALTPFGKTHKKMLFEDLTTYDNRTYTYMVTAVNRQHSESSESKVITVRLRNGKAKKVK